MGTSVSTPTTVARAAPDATPKRVAATAMAKVVAATSAKVGADLEQQHRHRHRNIPTTKQTQHWSGKTRTAYKAPTKPS